MEKIIKTQYKVKTFGVINWVGLRTLINREIQRFLNVAFQTLAAPVITSLIFLSIFNLAIGNRITAIAGIDFSIFIIPGIIMMSILQNSFANTSSSIMIGKVQGNIVDILIPPINNVELIISHVIGGVVRGIMVGLCCWIIIQIFYQSIPLYPIQSIIFAMLGSSMMALLGMIGAIWAVKFDHIAAFTNFFITPLTFLSGTFYSITRLPEVFIKIAYFNPFFHAINGIRYSFLGFYDVTPLYSYLALLTTNLLLLIAVYIILKTGYKLRN